MTTDLSEFHETFFEESFEAIDGMEASLLEIDCDDPNMDEVNSIFRGAHSIKGGAGMFGFTHVAEFTHVMETLLDEIRNAERSLSAEMVNVLLGAVDCLREMMLATQSNAEVDMPKVNEFREMLERLLAEGDEPVAVSSTGGDRIAADGAASAPVAASVQADDSSQGWRVRFQPGRDVMRLGNDPARLLRELACLGPVQVCCLDQDLPGIEDIDPELCYLSWTIDLNANVEREAVVNVFDWIEGECELSIEPLGAPAEVDKTDSADGPKFELLDTPLVEAVPAPKVKATPPKAAPQAPVSTAPAGAAAKPKEASSIRVGTDKVDDLINLVGELVITESMLRHFGTDFDIKQIEKLRDGLDQLARNTRELQESVMRIRMLPIKFCFSKFPRMVHDLCGKLGKKVELQLIGEQTELDKTVLEKINDPLVHAIRNCLDHGIESPEKRLAAGKPETGNVTLNAYHSGGQMVIEVDDDGGGLPRQKILGKARERGLVPENQELSDEEIDNLIFAPGFSTAEQVSDVSGRGVGMDVVRKNIADLGGSVHVRSVEGQGCTLTIRLPLTLAIMDGQLVRVEDEIFVVALASIVESLRLGADEINTIHADKELYRFREEYIPILRLRDHFSIARSTTRVSQGLLMIVEVDGQRVGLLVDELLNQQQVVIKSLERNYQQIQGLSGATIMGDGRIALILDIPGLLLHLKGAGNGRKHRIEAA